MTSFSSLMSAPRAISTICIEIEFLSNCLVTLRQIIIKIVIFDLHAKFVFSIHTHTSIITRDL